MEMAVGVVEATTEEGMRPPTAADRPGLLLLLLLLLRWRRRSLLSLETLAATMPSAPALAPVKSAGG
jgi:MYXO-CTERM domain-containing protein